MELKDVIRNKRIERGLTMKEFADMVGVSEATVSRWESGDIENMRRSNIISIWRNLDIPLSVLMGWEMDKTITHVPDIIIDVLGTKYSKQLIEYAAMLSKLNEVEGSDTDVDPES